MAVIFFSEFSKTLYVSRKIASLNIPHTGLEAKNCGRYRKQSFVGEKPLFHRNSPGDEILLKRRNLVCRRYQVGRNPLRIVV